MQYLKFNVKYLQHSCIYKHTNATVQATKVQKLQTECSITVVLS